MKEANATGGIRTHSGEGQVVWSDIILYCLVLKLKSQYEFAYIFNGV
jgi:hypothetical protein